MFFLSPSILHFSSPHFSFSFPILPHSSFSSLLSLFPLPPPLFDINSTKIDCDYLCSYKSFSFHSTPASLFVLLFFISLLIFFFLFDINSKIDGGREQYYSVNTVSLGENKKIHTGENITIEADYLFEVEEKKKKRKEKKEKKKKKKIRNERKEKRKKYRIRKEKRVRLFCMVTLRK